MRRVVLITILAFALRLHAGDAPAYDWGVAYYLSYDNDLGPATPVIVRAIRAGVTSEKTVAAVQVDLPGPGGMHRISITSVGATADKIASDDSADENQAIAYLDWFVKKFKCRHYAFIFLDHGGRLDEMCLDAEPETEGKFWMSGRVLGGKLREFKKSMPGQLDLLFFQQCGRGSLENLYSFRGVANYVMCSPVRVGSPNSYYTALHHWLPDHPDASGRELAEKIASEDKDFTVYTCLRGDKLEELTRHLDDALAPLMSKDALAQPDLPAAVYTESEESTRDAKTYLNLLAAHNHAGEQSMADFQKWIADELVTNVWYQKDVSADRRQELYGLSLFVPDDPAEALRYRDMDLYKDSSLGAFWRKLLPQRHGSK
jgi:hypothetical protein